MTDLARLLAAPDPPAAALAEAVLRHDGRIFQKQRQRIAALLRAEAERRDPALAAPAEALFLRSCTIHPALLALLLPPAAGAFPPEAAPPARIPLLPPGPNELHEPDILRRFRAAGGTAVATTLTAPARPEFALLERPGAEVAVGGWDYVTLDRAGGGMVAALSSRNLGTPCLPAAAADIPGDLVILRDEHDFRNLCHVLLDSLPRLLLLLERRPALARQAFFLCGPERRPVHDVLLAALAARFGLDPGRFLFPSGRIRLRPAGSVWGFSDQNPRFPPAFGGHPALVGLLRRFLATLPGAPEPGPPLRLFVSRRDAAKRRLVNEAEILAALAPLGFRAVALAEMPLPRQFALMRAAEAVVGPHGAGFTHLALHPGVPRLGEVLHPAGASSLAYRTLVRALGGTHRFLVGVPAPGRFDLTAAPEAVAALAEALLAEARHAGG